jgi:membrane protein
MVSPRIHQFLSLLREAWRDYERDYARYYAVAIVYYALVSLVPLLLLLLATLGLVLHMSESAAAAEHAVLQTVGASFGPELQTTLEELLQRLKDDSTVVTFISLVGLLLAASVLFKHLRLTFRAVWGKDPPLASRTLFVAIRATLLERAIAFLMVLGGGALLLASFVILTAVQWLAKLANSLPMFGSQVAFLLALPAPVLIATSTFALFFKVLPPVTLSWRHVWLASVICGVAWVIGAEALALYGAFVGRSVGPYGALGAVLVVMLWMNLISQMLFIGAELCKAVYSTEKDPTDARLASVGSHT